MTNFEFRISNWRKGRPGISVVLVLVGLLGYGGSVLAQSASSSREAENLETFDRAWEIVDKTHFDESFNGVDWQVIYDELRPQAAAAGDRAELREIMQNMVDRLGQSHFNFLPGSGPSDDRENGGDIPAGCDPAVFSSVFESLGGRRHPGRADVGLVLRSFGGDVVVLDVDEQSSGSEGGIQSGWQVLSVGEIAVEGSLACLKGPDGPSDASRRLIAWVSDLLSGATGTRVRVTFEAGDGSQPTLDLERRMPSGEVTTYGNLPPTRTRFEVHWHSLPKGDRVAVVGFNIWLLPVARRFEEEMDGLREADGVIIDLRGNPGGVAAIAQGVAGHFVQEKASLGVMKSRNDELNLFINPRRSTRDGRRVEPFAGPLAILIDGSSASTSELFAAGLQDLGRARLFGEPTAGAALPSFAERLPNGDVFLHATMDYVRPNGERVEGRPVQPDEPTPRSREDLVAGSDPALEAALDWIDQKRQAEK
jgi:carboxyl-terminal processing protease